ncbi:Lrp/AsnC family transcriptional regulator [Amycolatopsis jiangsuensis]|uniref:DNA-binding Lrp family transcriptional regulator n=1 Tax=Amycolatopsis jiangsuensis TaxID=1181879 RepID=A0A840IYJ3_9PSEU|nr:AsnC family transcriptional regulator [Amycolatopsis jiangsuensis]MBB4686763.1 DNA-binding Lrp family transcriptional regulator [Amycolatopsis jiangsuensis]
MSDHDSKLLDETDLALVDALQVHPRASWTRLAEVLDLAPITLARRWQHLVDTGSAWVTVALSESGMRGALLELTCRPGTAERVALTLARLPNVATVGVTTGEFQVFALVLAPTLPAIAETLVRALPIPPEVTTMRSHVYSGLFGGVVWRLGVMNRAQTELVREPAGAPPGEIRPFGPADRALFLALGHDGRRPYTELADELGTSPQAVKRRLDRLRRHGDITFRCDVARPLAGWESMALLWLAVPDLGLRSVGRRLGVWPETRHCAAIPGPANLSLIVSLRSLEHLGELLVRIAREHPEVSIVDRRIVLRQVKVHGRIVDELGRSTRVVPVDPWAMSS